MEKFLLIASERHPEIRLSDGLISIKGHSIPKNPRKIYKPVLQWVKAYVKNPEPHTEVLLQIDFFDSTSTKAIFDILKTLAICQNTNDEIEMIFKWFYLKEDDSTKEMGKFLESKLDVTFNYYEKTSDFSQDVSKGYI
jgi:hypothetical protein